MHYHCIITKVSYHITKQASTVHGHAHLYTLLDTSNSTDTDMRFEGNISYAFPEPRQRSQLGTRDPIL